MICFQFRFRRFVSLVLAIIAISAHASAQKKAPALYHAATGDQADKCVYVIFTFSEQSCMTCLSEISAGWCTAVDHLREPSRAGMLILFNTPRLEIADRMRDRLKSSGCHVPFIVDTNGALSSLLFASDAAGQMVVADAAGRVLVRRDVGEDDDFTHRTHLDRGPEGLAAYLDSLIGRCSKLSSTEKKRDNGIVAAPMKHVAAVPLRLLDSVVLQGADTVEMPFDFFYSPTDRMYAYLGGLTRTVYMHDSTGACRAALHLGGRMNPIAVAMRGDEIFAAGGESDTIRFRMGKDSVGVPDEIIALMRCDRAGRVLGRYRLSPLASISLANDVSLGAKKIYITSQRTATGSYIVSHGMDADHYLQELYNPRTYPKFIDTMKVIREYDSAMRPLRIYGSLPAELAKFGASRTHFWLEFQRWVKELPDGSVAFLHCASPSLRIYRDGVLASTIDLRDSYYRPITGKETDGNIPRYAGMIVGEDGRIYCEYSNAIIKKNYLIAVDPANGGGREIAELEWNDHLLRVEPDGKLHLLRKGRHLQLVVSAPIGSAG